MVVVVVVMYSAHGSRRGKHLGAWLEDLPTKGEGHLHGKEGDCRRWVPVCQHRQTDRQTDRQAVETTMSQEEHRKTVYTHYTLTLYQSIIGKH